MNLLNPSDVAALLSSEVCVRLTQALAHFLWQGFSIGIVVWTVDRLLPRTSSRFRYSAGVAALLTMLACVPLTYVALGFFPGNSPAETAENVAAPAVPATPESNNAGGTTISALPVDASVTSIRPADNVDRAVPASATGNQPNAGLWQSLHSLLARLAPYATAAYLLGVAIMLARLGLALRGGHKLRQSAAPLSDPAILAMAARQARRVGLKVVPAIAWCQRAAVPLVVGMVRPIILLPTAIAGGVAPDQLEALLAHELAHLKRLDLVVNLVQRLAESLLFFHPAVWYVSRRISSERENCCDDCVLAAGWGRVEYADALVRMAEVCATARGLAGMEGAALLAASGEGPSQFKRRVLRLIDADDHVRIGLSRGWLLATVATILLAIVAIPLASGWHGQADAAPAKLAPANSEATPVAPKPTRPAEKSEDAPRKEKLYLRGQDALDRIEKVKPAWSEAQNGVEFGIALIEDKKQFRSGQRVPLEMFVRNAGKEAVNVSLTADFLANVPEVKNAAGEEIPVEQIILFGLVPVYRETLKPGEAFGFSHVGLGLGTNPTKSIWQPFVAEPKAGKYTLRHTQDIVVAPAGEGKPGQRLIFTAGVVEFEVADGAAGDRRPPADDAKGTLQAALLDRRKYVEGKFPNDERLIKSEVFVAEQAVSKAQASLESSKRLAAKGLITAIQLQAAEAAVKQAQIQLDLAQARLDVLRRFTKEKVLRELDRKVVDAVEALLDQRVALKVADRPLIFVLDDLEKAYQVPIIIDLKEVHARGLSEHARVTVDVTDTPLRDVFKAVLASGGLNYDVTEKGIAVPAKSKPAPAAEKPTGPARLLVEYDIPGAEEEGQIVVQHGRETIGPKAIGSLHVNPLKNGQSLELQDLPPGDYDVTRYRTLMFGNDFGVSRYLDRRQFTLNQGQTKTIEFTRPPGRTVRGKVVGFEDAGLYHVLIDVCSENATGEKSLHDLKTTLFDARLCADDRSFTTEPLAPGTYTILAEGYVRLTPAQRTQSGIIRPRYVGVAKVTVPVNGEVPGVEVQLEDVKSRPADALGPTQGWGDLTVQFVYDGPRPEAKKIAVVRDRDAFGEEVVDQSLLVGAKGGLANVAVYVTSAGVPVHPEERRRAERPVELKVAGSQLVPRILPMLADQKLKLTNDTAVAVNFHCSGTRNAGFNLLVPREKSLEAQLDQAEKYPIPVHDNIHSWMQAFVLPLDHPYAAVSGADGIARLANLPQGEWTFRCWREETGFLKSAETGERDFKVKITPGENQLSLRVAADFTVTAAAPPAGDKPAPPDDQARQAPRDPPEPDATVRTALQQAGVSLTIDPQGRITEIYVGASADDDMLKQIGRLLQLKTLHIELARQLTAKGFESLAALPALQTLGLYDVPLPKGALASLARIRNLKELSLAECGLTDDDVAALAACAELTSLSLRGNAVTDAGLDSVVKLTKLEVLDLGNSSSVGSEMQITDDGLAKLAVLRRLRQLNLSSTRLPLGFTDKGLAHLSAFPDLESLDVAGLNLGDGALLHIGRCTNLRHLGLHFGGFTDEGMKEIRNLTKLKAISISSGQLTEQGLIHLGDLPKLEFAELRTGGVTDRVMERLSQIKSLARLDLYASSQPGVAVSLPPFTARGLAHFKDHPGLRTLWLTNVEIDDSLLAALKELTQLGELTLMMPRLSDDGVRELQAALPKTRVSAAWGGHGIAPLQLNEDLKRLGLPPIESKRN